jgi:hypothetical protein
VLSIKVSCQTRRAAIGEIDDARDGPASRATAFGLTIPEAFLLRADEIIE